MPTLAYDPGCNHSVESCGSLTGIGITRVAAADFFLHLDGRRAAGMNHLSD